ncbi:MAG: cobaltochelatase subunit CobN [Pseudomonadota bacterium]
MLDSAPHKPYRVAILTLDAHIAGPAANAEAKLRKEYPGVEITMLTAAEWGGDPQALDTARRVILEADIVVTVLLFLEEHVEAILPTLKKARENCDAMICAISATEIVRLTKIGQLDMAKPASGILALLKKLRGKTKDKQANGEKQMRMLRRLPRILKMIPGKAQDVRAYFLCMLYWLGGSDDNIESMIRYLISRYSSVDDWRGTKFAEPLIYPDVGIYHPDLPNRVTDDLHELPKTKGTVGTVGVLCMRSYVLAGDSAHYDAVIRALEVRGLRVIPVFASGLDNRAAIETYLKKANIDLLLSLTGFSLVGGPAFNDSPAAVDCLSDLDVPYLTAHPLEFQTIDQWQNSKTGLGPVEATMLIALPEIDGAISPAVFAGRPSGTDRYAAMAPIDERVEALANRVQKAVALRRAQNADKKLGIVIFGFPPNSGAVGTAAHLSVFESLFNTLKALKNDGYTVDVPDTVDALRKAVIGDPANSGVPANVLAEVSADDIIANDPWLKEIEAQWGPAPGRIQANGKSVLILGAEFGNISIAVQPAFGYEGDPMRLLFEGNFAPTHAFSTFYRWLRETWKADALLHFGMHGATEFMPGKQAGLGDDCWPQRLMGDVPNVYLYAANNPSEATLAKRRANAQIISHLTPPLAKAGLYKGLAELKVSLTAWRKLAPNASERESLEAIIRDQADVVDFEADMPLDEMWLKLLDTSDALIPEGLHVVGKPISAEAKADMIAILPDTDPKEIERVISALDEQSEMSGILNALSGKYIKPVPGGDLIRSTAIVPTGRNMHAFDPFRMPTAFALSEGRAQVQKLLATHAVLPRAVALVLWGSDNIKSDGGPLSQALALLGARPRFDAYGRLCGAELIPLSEMDHPRIDVVITLSGIFRDLLPMQVKLLAEACWLAANADEPGDQNFVRAHTRHFVEEMGIDFETAALRVFSNAEGAYGSNVNQLIDAGAWTSEEELANAYETRKSFAYDRNGDCNQNAALLQAALAHVDFSYQNLESVELGVTTMDHYFDTLGGINRAVKRARGEDTPVYISDTTRGEGKVRSLQDQIALESRTRSLNPKWYEPMLEHGHEGVRQIEAQVTNTMGWSATTGQVDPWIYQRMTETFVLDEEMKACLAKLNPVASAKLANRLIEAHDRAYWQADEETYAALVRGAEELEDAVEGVSIAAE